MPEVALKLGEGATHDAVEGTDPTKFGSEPLELDVRPSGDFLGQLQRSPAKVTVAVTVNECEAAP